MKNPLRLANNGITYLIRQWLGTPGREEYELDKSLADSDLQQAWGIIHHHDYCLRKVGAGVIDGDDSIARVGDYTTSMMVVIRQDMVDIAAKMPTKSTIDAVDELHQEVINHVKLPHYLPFNELPDNQKAEAVRFGLMNELPDNQKAAVIRYGLTLGKEYSEHMMARPTAYLPSGISFDLGFMQLTIMDYPGNYAHLFRILHSWETAIRWERSVIRGFIMSLSKERSGLDAIMAFNLYAGHHTTARDGLQAEYGVDFPMEQAIEYILDDLGLEPYHYVVKA